MTSINGLKLNLRQFLLDWIMSCNRIISSGFPRILSRCHRQNSPYKSNCNAIHMKFCPINLRFISWRALGNLTNSSGGTTLVLLFLFESDGRPACTPGSFPLLFFLFDFLVTVVWVFFTGLNLGCSENPDIISWRNNRKNAILTRLCQPFPVTSPSFAFSVDLN